MMLANNKMLHCLCCYRAAHHHRRSTFVVLKSSPPGCSVDQWLFHQDCSHSLHIDDLGNSVQTRKLVESNMSSAHTRHSNYLAHHTMYHSSLLATAASVKHGDRLWKDGDLRRSFQRAQRQWSCLNSRMCRSPLSHIPVVLVRIQWSTFRHGWIGRRHPHCHFFHLILWILWSWKLDLQDRRCHQCFLSVGTVTRTQLSR